MVQQIYQLCTSYAGLTWMVIASDVAIAIAYLSIPISMAVVFSHRKDDLPYPWLWILFATFIIACGLTHVVHVWSAYSGAEYIELQAIIGLVTASASLGTAVAFSIVLPQIRNLPSPRKQRAMLERMVVDRTADKDRLIREINHRVGNQLQIMSSLLRIEKQRSECGDTLNALDRISAEVERLNERHRFHSSLDYLGRDLHDDVDVTVR